jgi:cytochrome P450
MKGMEKYILQNIRTFCDGIGRTIDHREGEKEDHNGGWSSKGQNIADWANYLTFDIMGDLCFGKAFGMLDHPTNRFAIDLIGNAAHRHLICGTFPLLHRWHLDRFLFPHIAAGRARYMAYSKAQAVERTQMSADKSDRKDFFYYLLKAKDPETGLGFSMQELWGESNLLIIAGSDTTSTALASAIFYLVHNLTCLSKATAEVRNSFTDVEVIKPGEQLNNCHYLRAVIDEGMRLSPPVGGLLPREVLPGGLTIDDQPIPERAVVGVPHYAIHHNPSYFPDPFGFHPERWLVASKNERGEWSEGATKEEIDRARSAFAPFSLGPRGCIGKGMAYNELTTSLARLLWLFDMRLATEREGGGPLGEGREGLEWGRQRKGEYQLRDSFTSLKDGPVVVFRKRRE